MLSSYLQIAFTTDCWIQMDSLITLEAVLVIRHLKYVFWTMGVSTPMSQNGFPTKGYIFSCTRNYYAKLTSMHEWNYCPQKNYSPSSALRSTSHILQAEIGTISVWFQDRNQFSRNNQTLAHALICKSNKPQSPYLETIVSSSFCKVQALKYLRQDMTKKLNHRQTLFSWENRTFRKCALYPKYFKMYLTKVWHRTWILKR
jgi:hypothetical protein